MAPGTNSTLTRNTNNKGQSKAKASGKNRYWFLTLNNYDEKDIALLEKADCRYLFQEEKGVNGTCHLQGIFMFDNARTLSAMKKLHPKAHWEICRKKDAAINYCKKDKTRNGLVYSNFEYSVPDTKIGTEHKGPLTLSQMREIIDRDTQRDIELLHDEMRARWAEQDELVARLDAVELHLSEESEVDEPLEQEYSDIEDEYDL